MAYSPVKGASISSPYKGGFRRTGGHSGVDFAAPGGTHIFAAVGGTVISAGWGGAYGNLVKVRHDDGSLGYYAHMSAFGVKKGSRIDRGSYLGKVGNTGNVRGKNGGFHLHFEIRQNGKPVNPWPWLDGNGGKRSRGGLKSLDKQSGSMVEHQQLPDIVGYANPNDVLATLEQRGRAAGSGKVAGGFGTPALDAAKPGAEDDGGPASLGGMIGAEAQQIQQRQMQEQMEALGQLSEPAGGAPGIPADYPISSAPKGQQGALERLIAAIAGKESGGDYGARNKHSGALGKYQIMPGNIASWSRAAIGRTVTPTQFLRSPRLQEQIARHRLGSYFSKYGAAGAALAWYAGEGALKYSNSAKNRKQGQYPSMNDYVRDVLRRAGL